MPGVGVRGETPTVLHITNKQPAPRVGVGGRPLQYYILQINQPDVRGRGGDPYSTTYYK